MDKQKLRIEYISKMKALWKEKISIFGRECHNSTTAYVSLPAMSHLALILASSAVSLLSRGDSDRVGIVALT